MSRLIKFSLVTIAAYLGVQTFAPMSTDLIIIFLVTIFMLVEVQKAHTERKKEYF